MSISAVKGNSRSRHKSLLEFFLFHSPECDFSLWLRKILAASGQERDRDNSKSLKFFDMPRIFTAVSQSISLPAHCRYHRDYLRSKCTAFLIMTERMFPSSRCHSEGGCEKLLCSGGIFETVLIDHDLPAGTAGIGQLPAMQENSLQKVGFVICIIVLPKVVILPGIIALHKRNYNRNEA